MLGSRCCCRKKCGTTTNSGGGGTTITHYDFPTYSGMVEFRYNTYSIPDEMIVYNTNDEEEIYFETGGPVSTYNQRVIQFYKPADVASVTVKVVGEGNTAWTYTIGCPESCFIDTDPGLGQDMKRIKSLTLEVSGGNDIEIEYNNSIGRSYGYIRQENLSTGLVNYFIRWSRLDDPIWGTTEDRVGQVTLRLTYVYVNQIRFPFRYKWTGAAYNGTYIINEANNFQYFNRNYPYCNFDGPSGTECIFRDAFLLLSDDEANCDIYINAPAKVAAGLNAASVDFAQCWTNHVDFNQNYDIQLVTEEGGNVAIGILVDGIQGTVEFLGPSNYLTFNAANDIHGDECYGPFYDVNGINSFDGCTKVGYGGGQLTTDEGKFNQFEPNIAAYADGRPQMYKILNPEYPDWDIVDDYQPINVPWFEMETGTQPTYNAMVARLPPGMSPGNQQNGYDYYVLLDEMLKAGELVVKLNGSSLTFSEIYPGSDLNNIYSNFTLNPDLEPKLTVRIADYEVYED